MEKNIEIKVSNCMECPLCHCNMDERVISCNGNNTEFSFTKESWEKRNENCPLDKGKITITGE